MATWAQMAAESAAWNAEVQPPSLARVCADLRGFYGVSPAALGSKGDQNHTYGYHRSRRWILESGYSRNGSQDYSIRQALDKGGDQNWLSAIDMTVPAAQLYAACRRLDAAVRAGRLPQIREWFGSFDGKTVVGWDTVTGRAKTSDSSHLWHLHISLYRSRAGDNHSELYAVLTGTSTTTQEETDMRTLVRLKGRYYVWEGLTLTAVPVSKLANGVGDWGWVLGGKWQESTLHNYVADQFNNKPIPAAPHIDIPDFPEHLLPVMRIVEDAATTPAPVQVDAAEVAAALVADPAFAAALKQAAFEGAQRAERE